MTCPSNPSLPDDRINLQPPLIDFTNDVGTTGQAHDTFPEPGQARFDWMRSYLIGLLSNQSAFCEPIEFRIGTIWFDLNNASYKYRAGATNPILLNEGDSWLSLSYGIELDAGLSLQDWFAQVQALLVTPPDPNISSLFSKLTNATASEAVSAGSLVYVSSNRHVANADQSDPNKSEVIGVTTVSAGAGAGTVVQHVGLAVVRMDPGLALIAGQRVWLSTGGRGSNIEPLTGVFRQVGVVFDTSIYHPSDTNPIALVIVLPSGIDTDSSAAISMPAEVFVAGGTIGAGAVVYKTNVLNECKQANAAGPSPLLTCNTVLGIARNAATAGGTVLVDRFGGLAVVAEPSIMISAGDICYLSAVVAGTITNVQPSVSGSAVLVLGYAKQGTAVPSGPFVMSWSPRTPTVNP